MTTTPRSPMPVAHAAGAESSLNESSAMVLLVDDQAMVGEAIRRALAGEANIDIHYCSTPEDAPRVAETTRPTVILQDLVMPGTDGLSLVRQYRASPLTRDIPIIVLSTKEESTIKREAFAAGANDYLVKLPDPIELIARIRYHSRSYMNLLQRDEAYRALRESQQQLLETNLELQRLTHSDGLTGLANRRYFDEYFSAEWRRALREQREMALLMIDVDNFKIYNDTYGHIAGDDVLRRVATTIADAAARPADLAARFGGEEFVIVLPNTTASGAVVIAEKVRAQIDAMAIPHIGSANGHHVTISVGGASLVPRTHMASTSLIESADLALYRAKQLGKNRVEMQPGAS
ncbi:Phytochrome-like protein cph2 [Pandoraea eparura]|uniref:diguanylate cyclase n=1 Tax=Pandoraea eparura TaxID=2508291 RepID=A0A5E4TSC2_9BURK|nr:diguanylate cyclase [Pandoraea eparura]VVD90112.1 Phytochrome-like protein cph2 [Pandoraea eparura]